MKSAQAATPSGWIHIPKNSDKVQTKKKKNPQLPMPPPESLASLVLEVHTQTHCSSSLCFSHSTVCKAAAQGFAV